MMTSLRKTILINVAMFVVFTAGTWAESNAVKSTITEVTIYADRARVTREANIQLKQGTTVVSITGLPGWIDEGSVRASLNKKAEADITDVIIRREYLAEAAEEDVRKAQAVVWELSDKVNALQDEQMILEKREETISEIEVFSMEKLPKDATVGNIDMVSYGEVVNFISDSLKEIAEKKRGIEKKMRNLKPELEAQTRKLNDLHNQSQLEQRSVLVSIHAKKAGFTTLSLAYMLPGATWEPIHDLRADKESGKTSLISYARVSQTTGEDWSNVKLSFSTQRPSETIRIPQLDALLVGRNVKKIMQPEAPQQTFQVAAENFKALNTIWINQNPEEQQKELIGNRDRQDLVAQKMSVIFHKIQERGTTAHFYADGNATIRTDGNQVRVKIGEITQEAQEKYIAAPEISLNAACIYELSNNGEQPLLPGKVSLYLGHSFVGTTELDFVSEGEQFSLFTGVADQVKLTRMLNHQESSISKGRSRTKLHVEYTITAENLADETIILEIADRVPVSDTKDVQLSKIKISPEVEPDKNGLVHWTIELKAGETQTMSLKYTVDYPNTITEINRNKMTQSEAIDDLSIQLQSLESKL